MSSLCSYGAAGEVTGSCHLLETENFRVLMDCGLWQGNAETESKNQNEFAFDVRSLDAVLLSHAHIDHSGRLPMLVKAGFRGPIYAHKATLDLCRVMLKDAAHLHQSDVEAENRKRARKGIKPIKPLYDINDVEKALKLFVAVDYNETITLDDATSAVFYDAGHILGSSSIRIAWQQNGRERSLIYSGDVGQYAAPIMRDPVTPPESDYVMLESTYGDRNHRRFDDTLIQLDEILNDDKSLRGNIIIPAFAVGRTQEILYLFAKYYRQWRMHRWQLFLDSPMAIEATEIYLHHRRLHDEETQSLMGQGNGEHVLRKLLPNLHFTRTPEQSQSINRLHSGAIIIAGSGMCNGGRVKHHLKHLVWRNTTQVLMIGYQAYGTVGRRLVDGEKFIRLWGEAIRVNAAVHTLNGLSAHGGQDDLVQWLKPLSLKTKTLLVHGEAKALDALSATLTAQGRDVSVMQKQQRIEI